MLAVTDKRLLPIVEKVHTRERLTFDDGLLLYESHDLPTIGNLANQVRQRLHGDKTYYNINLHINPTNTCFMSCKFCAFGRKAFDENSYIRTPEDIVSRARAILPERATEIHLVGGLDPRLKLEYYCAYITALKQAFPHVHVKTLTPVEVVFIAKMSKMTVPDVVKALHEAGMDSMPGGGAEIFDEVVREQICEHKCDATGWFDTHRAAHQLGLRTNCTMLIGHVEEHRHRVDHLIRLRAHQDEFAARDAAGSLTRGFQCFIPLSFHPANTKFSHLPGPSGFDELRNIAVCRLMLDNIPHIKAYWIMLGIKQAQVAQWFGANDIDGTVTHEEIYHDAGATTPKGLTVADLRRLVRECGRVPVERDSVYNEVPEPAAAG
jgi:aminodeoxyfutalosine synthase